MNIVLLNLDAQRKQEGQIKEERKRVPFNFEECQGNREGITNQWRIIVTDYRELNKRTKSSKYTPPNIRAVLDRLGGQLANFPKPTWCSLYYGVTYPSTMASLTLRRHLPLYYGVSNPSTMTSLTPLL